MKKSGLFFGVVVSFICFMPDSALAEATDDTLQEEIIEREIEVIDPSTYTHEIPSLTNIGETQVVIDIDKWEEEIKKEYSADSDVPEEDISILSLEEYNNGTLPEQVENRSLEDLISVNEQNKKLTRGSAYTGPNLVNNSIAKIYVFFDDGSGNLIMGEASGFKASNAKVGTAGHVVYDKESGLGWAKMATVNFGFYNDPRIGWIASSIYTVSKMNTNQDWLNASSHSQGIRSDFGSLYVTKTSGTIPSNLNMLATPPSSLSGAVSWGFSYQSRYLTRSVVDVKTSVIRSDWFDWVYGDPNGIMYESMSGGPLLNSAGQVIGINSSSMNDVNQTVVYPKINSSSYNLIMK
ncbi:serine protease [Enterococcus sp. BWT-B8]|uniref:trypsin-like serine peptidase n=1 Tax=Enterococcus sp. BWT-B8 TaxID=2885157 RepID=UPI001E2F7857|nr:serine protease [Enterococcus sp. BWT-B8]MCB5952759.1 serine protease [Enterococcus sp. BWT-B8]